MSSFQEVDQFMDHHVFEHFCGELRKVGIEGDFS